MKKKVTSPRSAEKIKSPEKEIAEEDWDLSHNNSSNITSSKFKIFASTLLARQIYFTISFRKFIFVTMQADQEYTLSPKDGSYTAKWGLETLFAHLFPDEKISDQEYSLLIFDGRGSNPQQNTSLFKGIQRKMQSLSDNAESYPFPSPDAYYNRMTYDLKNTLKINNRDFFQKITDWEQGVKSLAIKAGALYELNQEIFVKVFIFIKLGYTTNYKKLADIFSMPILLYVPFEKLFEQRIQQK